MPGSSIAAFQTPSIRLISDIDTAAGLTAFCEAYYDDLDDAIDHL